MLHDTAFDRHTYKHTTMGFLKDMQDMPNQYDYSLKFFDRYYRPEYTTIIVVGDVKAEGGARAGGQVLGRVEARQLSSRYSGRARAEGAAHRDMWTGRSPTLPTDRDRLQGAGLHRCDQGHGRAGRAGVPGLLATLRDLYQKLVVQEQKVDALFGECAGSVDPSLFEITARVKKAEDVDYVRDQILETVKQFQEKPVDAAQAGHGAQARCATSSRCSMDNSDTIAQHSVAVTSR